MKLRARTGVLAVERRAECRRMWLPVLSVPTIHGSWSMDENLTNVPMILINQALRTNSERHEWERPRA